MNIQHGTNFNDPIELTEVIKYVPHKGTEDNIEEYSFLCNVCWEDIRGVDQYPYPDEWTKYPGEKFYVILAHTSSPKCILGSYEQMRDLWKEFRNMYPSFEVITEEESGEEE